MIKVSVFYPETEGASFDLDYYRETHVPLACKTWGLDGAQITKGVSGPYIVSVEFLFDSMDEMGTAMSVPGTADVMADVANFTTIAPVMQVSEVI